MSLFMSVKEITSCKYLGTQVKSNNFSFGIMSCQHLFDFWALLMVSKDLISTTLSDTFTFTTILNTFQFELLIVSLFISSEDTSENNNNNNKTRERQIKQNVRLSIVWISNIWKDLVNLVFRLDDVTTHELFIMS